MAGLFGFGGSTAAASSVPSSSEFLPDTPEQQHEVPFSQHSDSQAPIASTIKHGQVSSTTSATPADEPIELIFIDESPHMKRTAPRPLGSFGPIPMRTGYDKLLYGTGVSYLAGLSYGAVYGVIRGLQTAQVPNFKVRFNSIVNQTTRYGPWAANSLGVMTMTWAIMDNTLGMIRDKSDYLNHIGAAFASGVLFKSTAGARPALITGSLLATIVSAYGVFDYAMASNTSDSVLPKNSAGRKESSVIGLPTIHQRGAANA
ncbi:hypothetical protein BASA82_001206 [Batrachochytrium salamandrivorans]|uniref:Mitochondrial import inner membrane translocase subunit TIM23 n=1 Tax=Batrachochytrium salamandrivorans TaxID=1357716 RepID=A0ABQ8FA97_9FUNG|nr:hypothetical protein BASA60_009707 [Batrachochytrium salamandrivorans]KAH6568200.1 hypothetical protein BASA62_005604 [Batrachochytrium salamandrivorans]KAH6591808.1 hypothetical protein BASA61_004799 [Batrachochytrium salamandrivorans]KAH6593387.1 hypothetical protein BASA50_007339 [Batrachochytrium salamandrivorans]KAH9259891.1 hypothetical protein BASA82_001206 [Batrachochytrium salamandrivorans]